MSIVAHCCLCVQKVKFLLNFLKNHFDISNVPSEGGEGSVCRVVDTLVKTRGQQALSRRRRGGDNSIIHLVSGSLKRLYTV